MYNLDIDIVKYSAISLIASMTINITLHYLFKT